MVHQREHEDAAVRGTQGAAKRHGQPASHRRTDDAGGDDPQRVGRSKRNRALRNKAQPHNIIDKTGFALVGGDFFLEEGGA